MFMVWSHPHLIITSGQGEGYEGASGSRVEMSNMTLSDDGMGDGQTLMINNRDTTTLLLIDGEPTTTPMISPRSHHPTAENKFSLGNLLIPWMMMMVMARISIFLLPWMLHFM
jgi:hypothetical protein